MSFSVTETFRMSAPGMVCRHISMALSSVVYYLDQHNAVRFAFSAGQPSVYLRDSDIFTALFGGAQAVGYPMIRLTRPGEAYLAVDLFEEDVFTGRLVAGPLLCIAAADTVKYQSIVSAAILLYHFVYGQWVDESTTLEHNYIFDVPDTSDSKRQKKQHRGTPSPVHHSIAYEKQIYALVTDGNKEKLLENMKDLPDGAYGLLDRSHPLRNLKNDFICSVTLATRAAVSGGLDSETALTVSDDYIQQVETLDDVIGLKHLAVTMLCDFTDRVAKEKQLNYSYKINLSKNYINAHVFEKISIPELAKHTGLSTGYFSQRFKKETGVSPEQYIRLAKIRQAERLLTESDESILELTAMLNFHDQSHFTKAFKKVTGLTPRKYRETKCIV